MPTSMGFNYDDTEMVNLFPCAYSLMNVHFLLPAKSNYLFAIICTDVAKLEFSWLSAKTWGPEEYVLCQIFLLASGLMSPVKRELFAPGVGFYNRHFQNSKLQAKEVLFQTLCLPWSNSKGYPTVWVSPRFPPACIWYLYVQVIVWHTYSSNAGNYFIQGRPKTMEK